MKGQTTFPFNVTCPKCDVPNGAHAYWCPIRKELAADRKQGS